MTSFVAGFRVPTPYSPTLPWWQRRSGSAARPSRRRCGRPRSAYGRASSSRRSPRSPGGAATAARVGDDVERGAERHGRRAAHQPRPRTAVRLPPSRRCVRSAGTVDIEFDLATGARARRGRGTLDALAQALPHAGDVAVVNNGAAALLLAVTVLAAGREVIVSRGELVEIGDGFRLPDLLVATGARLREVGTTNRTALSDYATAIGPDTGCILKVHPSNFRITGFTSDVGVADLAGLGSTGGRRRRQRPAAARSGYSRTSPTSRRRCAAGRRPGDGERRQAARRPAGRHPRGHRRAGAALPAGPARPGVARRQADARRSRGHLAYACDPDLGGAACERRHSCMPGCSSWLPRPAAGRWCRAPEPSAAEARPGSSSRAGRWRCPNAAPDCCAPAARR